MKFIDGRPHPEKFNQLQKFKKENVKHFPGFDLEDEELLFELDAHKRTPNDNFNLILGIFFKHDIFTFL